jgi:tetratricopeptide (TPR) repeat protein
MPRCGCSSTGLAWVAIDEGNVVQAAAPYETARELYHESGERPHPVFPVLGPLLSYFACGDEARARAGLADIVADDGADVWIQVSALMFLGIIDSMGGRYAEAEANLTAAVERSRGAGDRWVLAQTLARLAEMAENRGDYRRAGAALLEALGQIEPLDAREDVAWLWIRLGVVRSLAGDERAPEQIAAGIDRARHIGATEAASMGLYYAAAIARHRGDLAAARRGYEESQRMMETMQANAWYHVHPIIGLGFVAELEGDVERADACHRQALRALVEEPAIGAWSWMVTADAVEGLAGAAAAAGRAERAATLLGAAAALRRLFQVSMLQRMDRDRVSAAARGQLGAERFERARRRGEAMTLEDVLGVIA